MTANADNVLLLSDIDSILEKDSSDPYDVLAVIALLSEPSCGLLKMNYRSGLKAGEVSNIELMKQLRAWWREESITNEEWKAWAGSMRSLITMALRRTLPSAKRLGSFTNSHMVGSAKLSSPRFGRQKALAVTSKTSNRTEADFTTE